LHTNNGVSQTGHDTTRKVNVIVSLASASAAASVAAKTAGWRRNTHHLICGLEAAYIAIITTFEIFQISRTK